MPFPSLPYSPFPYSPCTCISILPFYFRSFAFAGFLPPPCPPRHLLPALFAPAARSDHSYHRAAPNMRARRPTFRRRWYTGAVWFCNLAQHTCATTSVIITITICYPAHYRMLIIVSVLRGLVLGLEHHATLRLAYYIPATHHTV